MTRQRLTGNLIGRSWTRMRRLLNAPRKRDSRRLPAAIRFEPLETRRVMYGADLFDLAEGEAGSQVAEFALTDVNPNSATYNQQVSPSDYLQQVSAWYFGHST